MRFCPEQAGSEANTFLTLHNTPVKLCCAFKAAPIKSLPGSWSAPSVTSLYARPGACTLMWHLTVRHQLSFCTSGGLLALCSNHGSKRFVKSDSTSIASRGMASPALPRTIPEVHKKSTKSPHRFGSMRPHWPSGVRNCWAMQALDASTNLDSSTAVG